MLTGSPAEATTLRLEIADVIEVLFNPEPLEIISESYHLPATSQYGKALGVRFVGRELHSKGSAEKCKLALRIFLHCFEASANKSSPLKEYGKALFYSKSGRGNAASYHQHTLITGSFFKTFISLHKLAKPTLKPN